MIKYKLDQSLTPGNVPNISFLDFIEWFNTNNEFRESMIKYCDSEDPEQITKYLSGEEFAKFLEENKNYTAYGTRRSQTEDLAYLLQQDSNASVASITDRLLTNIKQHHMRYLIEKFFKNDSDLFSSQKSALLKNFDSEVRYDEFKERVYYVDGNYELLLQSVCEVVKKTHSKTGVTTFDISAGLHPMFFGIKSDGSAIAYNADLAILYTGTIEEVLLPLIDYGQTITNTFNRYTTTISVTPFPKDDDQLEKCKEFCSDNRSHEMPDININNRSVAKLSPMH